MAFIIVVVLGILAVVVVVVLVAASSRPDSFRVQRQIEIEAPAEKIFPLIDDFQRWTAWSPWEKLDPALKRTFSGASSGKGAVYQWQGNAQAGSGRMEILEARPHTRLVIKLDFIKPFEAHNHAEFEITSEGLVSRVVWSMTGPQAFPMKVMSLFMSMDRMVGKDFEKGLLSMKALAEKH